MAKILLAAYLIATVMAVNATSMMDGFIDPEDGMFDVSHWLAEKQGFFPVPVIITEPAVGVGLGMALVFLHDPLAGRFNDISGTNPALNVYSKGAGMRYFIARRFGAHVGFDIAKGPEDTAFYLQFGHPWR